MPGVRRPEELDTWKLAWDLKERVHAFTSTPPASKDCSFCDEIRRASRSASDNISEGFYRFNPREFHRFLNDAKGSLGEVRNQLLHAKSQGYLTAAEFEEIQDLSNRAIGAATRLQAYLRGRSRQDGTTSIRSAPKRDKTNT
jgi:four helix bundle protein